MASPSMPQPRLAKHALAAELAAVQQRYRTLFETLPLGVIYYAADGLITAANPAASEMIGVDASDMLTWPTAPGWHAVREDGTPFPTEEVPVAAALRTGEVVADVLMGVPHGQTGELRWLLITAVPEAPDQDGRPQRAYAIFKDLTEQCRTEATHREGIELMGRLSAANVLGMVVADEERVYDANDTYLEIIGYTRHDLDAGGIAWREITPPEWAGRHDDAGARCGSSELAAHSRKSTYTGTGTACRSSLARPHRRPKPARRSRPCSWLVHHGRTMSACWPAGSRSDPGR